MWLAYICDCETEAVVEEMDFQVGFRMLGSKNNLM